MRYTITETAGSFNSFDSRFAVIDEEGTELAVAHGKTMAQAWAKLSRRLSPEIRSAIKAQMMIPPNNLHDMADWLNGPAGRRRQKQAIADGILEQVPVGTIGDVIRATASDAYGSLATRVVSIDSWPSASYAAGEGERFLFKTLYRINEK